MQRCRVLSGLWGRSVVVWKLVCEPSNRSHQLFFLQQPLCGPNAWRWHCRLQRWYMLYFVHKRAEPLWLGVCGHNFGQPKLRRLQGSVRSRYKMHPRQMFAGLRDGADRLRRYLREFAIRYHELRCLWDGLPGAHQWLGCGEMQQHGMRNHLYGISCRLRHRVREHHNRYEELWGMRNGVRRERDVRVVVPMQTRL